MADATAGVLPGVLNVVDGDDLNHIDSIVGVRMGAHGRLNFGSCAHCT
jgi:hypothetical protein